MAIIIPSKTIYKLNNPKVRDNVIDAVTVSHTVVNNDNKYNTTVHLEKYTESSFSHAFEPNFNEWTKSATVNAKTGNDTYVYYAGASVGIRTHYNFNPIQVYIDRAIENAYISSIFTGYNKNGNPNINYNVIYKHYVGKSKIRVRQYPLGGDNSDVVDSIELTYDYNDYTTSQGNLPKLSLEKTTTYSHQNLTGTLTAKANVSKEDETTLYDDNILKNYDETFFYFQIDKILCGVETYSAYGTDRMSISAWGGDPTSTERYIDLFGTCEKYVPVELQISFNGDTISFVIEEDSVSYGSEEPKKPFLLSGSEIIQSGGKFGGTNLSSHLSDIIMSQYEKGKETATLTCSINDYYDSNGNLIVSPKSDQKMLFEIYDKVVPMVRQSYGVDAPMSLTSENYAKVFEVVGVRVYYDGAVWQELTLKEFDESANIQIQLPAPTIRIADDILYIQDGSGLGKSFQIYVDGNAQVITDSKTYPISNLPSITQGSHSIYVVSLGYENYTSSVASNVVTYVKKVPLSAPVISIIDSTLVINDTSGKAEQFAVYANGTLILYTKASTNTINLKSHISKEGTYTITVSAYADGYTASAMSNEVPFTRIVPLASPTITLSGKTITITDNSGKAETFNVYVDNTFLLSTPANQNVVDLSNLIFAEGNYEVFATALAQGYDESAKSNTVTVPIMMDVEGGYLTFVGEDGEFTLTGSDYWDGQVYISTDAQNWSEWNGKRVSSVDSKIYLRGINNTTMRGTSSSVQAILRFSGSATKVACYGNIANLLDYSKVSAGKINEIEMADSCFRYLFRAQTLLTRCPELPLTTLSKNCYYEMFSGCTQLSTLPKLPATTLQEYCYNRMFYNCSAIKLSTTKSDEYPNEYRIPTEGNISSGLSAASYDMFANTGGTFKPTGNADILNKVFYTANEIV